jgi:hypothetical protein
VVHAPALAPQQHVELLITRAQANGGEFPQARSQGACEGRRLR